MAFYGLKFMVDIDSAQPCPDPNNCPDPNTLRYAVYKSAGGYKFDHIDQDHINDPDFRDQFYCKDYVRFIDLYFRYTVPSNVTLKIDRATLGFMNGQISESPFVGRTSGDINLRVGTVTDSGVFTTPFGVCDFRWNWNSSTNRLPRMVFKSVADRPVEYDFSAEVKTVEINNDTREETLKLFKFDPKWVLNPNTD